MPGTVVFYRRVMADVRLGLLMAVMLGVAACSSEPSPVDDTPNAVVEQDASTASPEATAVEHVGSRQAFRRLAERTKIFVGGADVATAAGVVECFGGTCSSPLDYERGVELVMSTGVELRFEHPDIELRGSARILSADLRFVTIESDGSAAFRFAEPGLHHLSVSGEIRSENGSVDRFHHFAWVQVVEDGSLCGEPVLPVGSISGVTDEVGCPSAAGELNFAALNPLYHCHPWPARLRLDARPGSTYVRVDGEQDATPIISASTTGLHVASQPIFVDNVRADVVYVFRERFTGPPVLDRWVLEESPMECI